MLAAFAALASLGALAHLIDAQRGTLNLVGDGAFLVLSVPVSAFRGVDDDGDGRLSLAELRRHHAAIESQAVGSIRLLRGSAPIALEGVMLTLSPEHGAPEGVARHLVVMGRFALPAARDPLLLEVALFGLVDAERRYLISITRGRAELDAVLTPAAPRAALGV